MKKTVVITGASSGIGKAAAKLFAANGWNVAATMRAPDAEAELGKIDGVFVTRLDVQDAESIQQGIDAAIARFGKIDLLINNAGYGQYGVFESIPPEKVRQQFDVNVFGLMDVTRAILPHFRKNKSGMIINISSGAGHFTLPMISLYCATKFAVEGFSESLSYELASQNIVVKLLVVHGGVSGTRFNEKSAANQAGNNSIADYEDFLKRTDAAMAKRAAAVKATTEDVARVIFTAATDGTNRLRYFVGNDNRGLLRARQEMTEEEYMAFMRKAFEV